MEAFVKHFQPRGGGQIKMRSGHDKTEPILLTVRRLLFAFTLLASAVFAQVPKSLRTAEDALQAERALKADPRNDKLAGDILEFYLNRWPDPKLHDARVHLLMWIIANRPDIDLAAAVHDPRGLLVNPDDKEAYTPLREAWLRQTALQPGNARVLYNAARCLRLTDRESAANWLKTAANYDTETTDYSNTLARLYAEALTGVVAMSPFEEPTRLDSAVTQSLFARQVKEEAMQDSILGAHLGWSVHLIAMALRAAGLTETDYDTVAEEIMINAANLDYPKPAKIPVLAQFYRDQGLKVSHKILPKFPEIEVKPKDEANALVDFEKKITADEIKAPIKVPVSVMIGMDGHVWKAESPLGAEDKMGKFAVNSLLRWTFKPLRVSGEPVQVVTTFDVTIEPVPPEKRKN